MKHLLRRLGLAFGVALIAFGGWTFYDIHWGLVAHPKSNTDSGLEIAQWALYGDTSPARERQAFLWIAAGAVIITFSMPSIVSKPQP